MDQVSEVFLKDIWDEVMAIYVKESKRIRELKNQSRLQAGIMNYLRVAWRKGKTNWSQGRLHIDVYEPFSWSDDSYKIEAGPYIAELTDEQLTEEVFPALCERMDQLFRSEELGPLFFDYRFEVVFEFERERSRISLHRNLLNESKLHQLQQSLEHFIQSKILADLPVLPNDNDMFFFARHLVNPDLMKQEEEVIEPLIRRLLDKLNMSRKRKNEWIRQYTSAFNTWAQEHFLPQYFVPSGDYGFEWILKEEDRQVVDEGEMDFFLYIALQIGFTEPDNRKKYLELAVKLGSQRAADYLKIGSGKFANTFRSERVECSNNDVTQLIEVRILSEEEAAYGEALDYIIHLLRQGFSKSYSLKLKSSQKHFLPLKKLAKSKLHQFFANALTYPALFPKLAEYADTVMEEFAWYGDVEPGEKSVMPGTYAVMGLGLYSESYYPLVGRYMELVDTEHQMVQDDYAEAFIDAHGLTAEKMPVLVSILLGGNEEGKYVKNETIDDPELAGALVDVLKGKKDHERELVLYRLFKSSDKLAGAARKSQSPLKEELEQLLALWG
ncbi:hypothetical protein DFP94_1011380 [Fontibacillus phaseoli]|uniref:Uncharacterized protein n=1 Tax=Fontibacillus phaseoli TaxID=1416533 RepID=A0A369BSX0_9BACL|nr:DUF6138 family protein [Fontibacillus phaseoli]RCX23778.1 hypothetical protein DFP94_1011380 [Fontibacillus phaseoli]